MGSVDTMHRWPIAVKDDAKIPVNWVQARVKKNKCTSAVYFPNQKFGLFNKYSIVLGLKKDSFFYSDSKRSATIAFKDIIALKHLSVLLTGKLMIRTKGQTYKIEYNLTKESLVKPFIEAYRTYSDAHAEFYTINDHRLKVYKEKVNAEKNFREKLFHKNLKLSNYLQDQFPNTEKKEMLYYQESTEQTGLKKKFSSRHYYTPYLIIRTEKELMLFNEEDHIAKRPDEYGMQVNLINDSEHIKWTVEKKQSSGELRILFDKKTLFKLHVPKESMQRASAFCKLLNT